MSAEHNPVQLFDNQEVPRIEIKLEQVVEAARGSQVNTVSHP